MEFGDRQCDQAHADQGWLEEGDHQLSYDIGWNDGGVGVPKRQAGGAHLTTAHPPEVSAPFVWLAFLSRCHD